ncbi:hypothetical protein B0H12DRAFT_770477 [Mycena haematopus]|nr:hypothetical protein B0H12DRAFT_770477 [Mycena haematopus]
MRLDWRFDERERSCSFPGFSPLHHYLLRIQWLLPSSGWFLACFFIGFFVVFRFGGRRDTAIHHHSATSFHLLRFICTTAPLCRPSPHASRSCTGPLPYHCDLSARAISRSFYPFPFLDERCWCVRLGGLIGGIRACVLSMMDMLHASLEPSRI